MAERWEIEKMFIKNDWELLSKTEESTVLTREGEEVYISDEAIEGMGASDSMEVTIKLNDIKNLNSDSFEVFTAHVRVTL